MSQELASSAVKTEVNTDTDDANPRPDLERTCLDSQQRKLITALKNGASDCDPAQNSAAWQTWQHLAQYIGVSELLQTHDDVSPKFLHGPHRGESVADLTRKLCVGEAYVEDITPLVVVRFQHAYWVVFGKRRLKALKDFQQCCGEDVRMCCIVHDLDDRPTVPHQLVTKFIDASTTTCGGIHAEFENRYSRKHWR